MTEPSDRPRARRPAWSALVAAAAAVSLATMTAPAEAGTAAGSPPFPAVAKEFFREQGLVRHGPTRHLRSYTGLTGTRVNLWGAKLTDGRRCLVSRWVVATGRLQLHTSCRPRGHQLRLKADVTSPQRRVDPGERRLFWGRVEPGVGGVSLSDPAGRQREVPVAPNGAFVVELVAPEVPGTWEIGLGAGDGSALEVQIAAVATDLSPGVRETARTLGVDRRALERLVVSRGPHPAVILGAPKGREVCLILARLDGAGGHCVPRPAGGVTPGVGITGGGTYAHGPAAPDVTAVRARVGGRVLRGVVGHGAFIVELPDASRGGSPVTLEVVKGTRVREIRIPGVPAPRSGPSTP